jgi:hypothetical protein
VSDMGSKSVQRETDFVTDRTGHAVIISLFGDKWMIILSNARRRAMLIDP